MTPPILFHAPSSVQIERVQIFKLCACPLDLLSPAQSAFSYMAYQTEYEFPFGNVLFHMDNDLPPFSFKLLYSQLAGQNPET